MVQACLRRRSAEERVTALQKILGIMAYFFSTELSMSIGK